MKIIYVLWRVFNHALLRVSVYMENPGKGFIVNAPR